MTEEKVQSMINDSIRKAMDKHNKTASLISAIIGCVLLGFYTHGVIAVVDHIS